MRETFKRLITFFKYYHHWYQNASRKWVSFKIISDLRKKEEN